MFYESFIYKIDKFINFANDIFQLEILHYYDFKSSNLIILQILGYY